LLEDDPAMWLPQFHVNRTQRDVQLASKYGCQGMLGIHWRHRIMDATAGYLAKAAWDDTLTPASHFGAYAKSQASGDRASRLGDILNDIDLHQKILHTGTNQVEDGHVVTREWAADYDQGFLYWRDYEPQTPGGRIQKDQILHTREHWFRIAVVAGTGNAYDGVLGTLRARVFRRFRNFQSCRYTRRATRRWQCLENCRSVIAALRPPRSVSRRAG
jgi:hypothetical protein